MRNLIVVIAITVGICLPGWSNEPDTTKSEGKGGWIQLKGEHERFGREPYFFSVNLELNLFFRDRWAFNYHVGLGKAFDNSFHVSSHAGAALGVNLLANIEDDSTSIGKTLRGIGFFSIFLPEGVSYYIPLGPRSSVTPYLNTFSYDYRKNETLDLENFWLSFEFGASYQYYLNRKISIGPFLGGKWIYTRSTFSPWGVEGGVVVRWR